MLERAARCLKSRVRQSWITSRQFHPSTHQLHEGFWRHGATNLVAAYCLGSIHHLFEPLCRGWRSVDNIGFFESTHPFFLSFLYPPDAQNLLKRWTKKAYRQYTKQVRESRPSHTRRFSSARRQEQDALAYEQVEDGLSPEESAESGSKQLLEVATTAASEDLEEQLAALGATHGRQESILWLGQLLRNDAGLTAEDVADDIWLAYQNLPQSTRIAAVRKKVLNFLSHSTRNEDQLRVAEILYTFTQEEIDENLANLFVVTLSNTQQWSRAIEYHSAYLYQGNLPYLSRKTTSSLFLSAFKHHEWSTALVVLADRYIKAKRDGNYLEYYRPWFRGLLGQVQKSEQFFDSVLELTELVADRKVDLSGSPRGQAFMGIMTAFFRNGPSLEQHWTVLDRLESVGRSRHSFYEKTALAFLNASERSLETTQLLFDLYREYRKSSAFNPTADFLRSLIREATMSDDESFVRQLRQDLARYHPFMPFDIGIILMGWYGRHANLTEARNVLAECLEGSHPHSISVFYPLLRAEALRFGPLQVQTRLSWIQKKFGFKPDLKCFNILLQAQGRANDASGCKETFQALLEAGITPDEKSFSAVLSMAAERGDTQIALRYVRIALDQNIPISKYMSERMVVTHLKAGEFKQAVALGERMAIESPTQATSIWSHILGNAVTRRRLRRALAVCRRMRILQVPFDGYTYAALMRVFTLSSRPDKASSLMQTNMTKEGLKPTALHYAILMDGYAMTNNFKTAWKAYAQMLKGGIPQNLSSRLALLKIQALTTKQKLANDYITHPGVRLDLLEELLEEMIVENPSKLIMDRDLQILIRGYRATEAFPAVYFDAVLDAYSKIRSQEIIRLLMAKFEALRNDMSSEPRERWSLRVIYRVMCMRAEIGDYEVLEELWQTSFETAQTLSDVVREESARPSTTNMEPGDSSSSATQRELRTVPETYRYVLNGPLRYYLRYLHSRGDTSMMASVVGQVHAFGFALKSDAWNTYVRLLASGGFLIEAYQLAEAYLMQHFKGFYYGDRIAGSDAKLSNQSGRPLGEREANQTRSRLVSGMNVDVEGGLKERGMQYLGRSYEHLAPGQLHIEYDTLLHLRRALRDIGEASLGTAPGDVASLSPEENQQKIDYIRENAPETFRAVQYLPGLHLPQAYRVLGANPAGRVTNLSAEQMARRTRNRLNNRRRKRKLREVMSTDHNKALQEEIVGKRPLRVTAEDFGINHEEDREEAEQRPGLQMGGM